MRPRIPGVRRAFPTMRSLVWLTVALPLAALGQETPGIDLTKPAPPPRAAEPPLPPPPPGTRAKAETPLEGAVGAPGERDAALGDRVKAVQRKGFLKRGRFQATAIFSPTVNDAFYQKFGFGLRLAYNVADSFAVAVRGSYYLQVQTDYRKQAALAFDSLLLASRPYGEAMLEGIWSPVHGKFSWFDKSIIHFDLFLAAGAGAAWSATSFAPRSEGPHPAAEVGGGVRFYPADWMAAEFGILATLYPDQTDRAVPATVQKVLAATFGVSFFLPSSFEYRNP